MGCFALHKPMARHHLIAAIALCSHMMACSEDLRFFDRFPVPFNDDNGPILLGASIPEFPTPTPTQLVMDTLSPVSVFDPAPTAIFTEQPTRIRTELTVFGFANPLSMAIPRLVYPLAPLVTAHPCGTAGACLIGDANAQIPFGAILGGDRLSSSSIRISFCKKTLEFLRDTVGTVSERIETCDIVFPMPFTGGGTIQIDGTEIPFSGVRPSLSACVETETPQDDALGVDMQLLFSSAVGNTILTRTAYEKIIKHSGAVAFDALPQATAFTPSGPIDAKLGSLEKMAFVSPIGEEQNARGPCLELAAHRLVTESQSFEDQNGLPCPNGDSFCQIGPSLEMLDSLEVYVVSDEEPLFQSLRDELRPDLAEIDGIVGTAAMQSLKVDMDYPNQRMLFSCEDTSRCIARASIFTESRLEEVIECLEQDVDNCQQP